ncbi:predicted protein, partial [Nematostella vectensis]
EKDVGITEFIAKHEGFQGVLKQRYVDFIVYERNLKGNLVRLTSQTLPETEAKPTVDASVLSDEDRQKITSVLESKEKNSSATLTACEDKELRTKIHHAVKQEFPTLESDTVTVNDGRKAVRVFRFQGNPSRKRPDRWPAGRPDHCKFVLFKENKDTMEAISLLAKLLHVKPGVFGYAGTKDRRGVTVQEVSGYKVLAERLQGLNNTLRGLRLGNFEYCKEKLRLGDLSGNHFVITLRNVSGNCEVIERAMTSLKDVGFINYFGLQRFGTSCVPTHHIGRALILSQWSEAVDLILNPREGKPKDFNKALEYWKSTGDAKGALSRLARKKCIESYLLQGFVNQGSQDLVGALQMIPRNTRLMYVHAYQSYIWNNMVSHRIREYGLVPVEGDLVVSGHTQVRTLSHDDISSQKYSIHDVVMPVPGYDVTYPGKDVRDWYRELMAVDGVDIDKMRHRVKDYSLSGAYRPIIIKPQHTSWKFIHYNDVTAPLALTDLDRLEGRTDIPAETDGQYLALQIELTLPSSCYATMALREVLRKDTSPATQAAMN